MENIKKKVDLYGTAIFIVVLMVITVVVAVNTHRNECEDSVVTQDSLDVWINKFNDERAINFADEILMLQQSYKLEVYDTLLDIALYGTRKEKSKMKAKYLDMKLSEEENEGEIF